MKKADIEIGKTYVVKVSGILAPVRITGESRYGGWDGVNTKTNRTIRIKSAQRIRRPWTDPTLPPYQLYGHQVRQGYNK